MSTAEASQENPFADGAAFIDGGYVPIAEARLPVLDWGVTRSDLTYDVVAAWNGRFFRLDDHLDRFFRGMERLHLSSPHDREETAAILEQCVRRAGLRDAYVEMVTTRGMPPPGRRDPRLCENRFYAFAIPYVWIVPPERQQEGIDLIVGAATRISPASVDPTVKNFHWGDLTRGLFEAYERGGDSVVLTDGEGNVTEGPGFNLFAFLDGRLITPADGVLLGITRMTVIELARGLNVKVEVGRLTADELARAGEIFLSSTAGGVMPVRRLDGRAVGDGAPGPLTVRLRQLYWEAHEDPRHTREIRY